jgi:hypothetical protein
MRSLNVKEAQLVYFEAADLNAWPGVAIRGWDRLKVEVTVHR